MPKKTSATKYMCQTQNQCRMEDPFKHILKPDNVKPSILQLPTIPHIASVKNKYQYHLSKPSLQPSYSQFGFFFIIYFFQDPFQCYHFFYIWLQSSNSPWDFLNKMLHAFVCSLPPCMLRVPISTSFTYTA